MNGRAAFAVLSHRDVPWSCLCDWAMTFAGGRPSGWVLVKARPGCPCHRTGAGR